MCQTLIATVASKADSATQVLVKGVANALGEHKTVQARILACTQEIDLAPAVDCR